MSDIVEPFGDSQRILPGCELRAGLSDSAAGALARRLAGMDPWLTLGIKAEALHSYFQRPDPGLFRFEIRVGAECAGAVCVRHPWLRGPYLELLGIAPEYQGRGLGSVLLAWAEAEARRGAGNLWVVASAFNLGALRFYRRHGFVDAGVLPGLVRSGHDEILLRKHWGAD